MLLRVGSCWQTMLRPFARGLTQQNSMGGGGGELSSSHRGHVSMWRWICTTLPPEVRSWNTYDEIRRAFGLIKLPRWKLEKKSEIRREKKTFGTQGRHVHGLYWFLPKKQRDIYFVFLFVHGPKQGFKTAEFEREGGRGWGEGGSRSCQNLLLNRPFYSPGLSKDVRLRMTLLW